VSNFIIIILLGIQTLMISFSAWRIS